jgi:signal transduction histidine kinase/DNA-binding NarL/FixJ family response regulator
MDEKLKEPRLPWKILIVDDEPEVHTLTRLGLSNFEFAKRPLQLFEALSAQAAKEILVTEANIAVAIIDVVMESDDAGLKLINFIRKELNNRLIRLIIRTGQQEVAPVQAIIEHYDIDDYKDKTELTIHKLYTTIRLALKSYHDLSTLDANRQALKKILDVAPELYHPQSIHQFFSGVLEQIIGLCNLGEHSLISTVSHGLLITTAENQNFTIQSRTGRFAQPVNSEAQELSKLCLDYLHGNTESSLPLNAVLIPLKRYNQLIGLVYLENAQHLSQADYDLIHIMTNQCVAALENLQLYFELKEANQQTSYMLTIAEQARKMAEAASQAKSTFLAKMSHELRTPLNAIIGYSDMIQEEAIDFGCEALLPDLDKVHLAGKQLLDIISNILDISKIEAGKLELNLTEFSVETLVAEVVTTIHPLIKMEGHVLQTECNQELGILYADYHKLRQILLNILNNAAKFTQQGQIIFSVSRKTLSILVAEDNSTAHSPTGNSEWLFFQITDSGIGIEPDKLNMIFEAFAQADNSFTREYDGTGLGLTISEYFCRAMGGRIFVSSTLGEGSTFTVQLPSRVVTIN